MLLSSTQFYYYARLSPLPPSATSSIPRRRVPIGSHALHRVVQLRVSQPSSSTIDSQPAPEFIIEADEMKLSKRAGLDRNRGAGHRAASMTRCRRPAMSCGGGWRHVDWTVGQPVGCRYRPWPGGVIRVRPASCWAAAAALGLAGSPPFAQVGESGLVTPRQVAAPASSRLGATAALETVGRRGNRSGGAYRCPRSLPSRRDAAGERVLGVAQKKTAAALPNAAPLAPSSSRRLSGAR